MEKITKQDNRMVDYVFIQNAAWGVYGKNVPEVRGGEVWVANQFLMMPEFADQPDGKNEGNNSCNPTQPRDGLIWAYEV